MRTELRLPFPPTVNNLFSGTTRRFTSPKYVAWQREASLVLLTQPGRLHRHTAPVEVVYTYGKPDNRARDVFNYEKAVSDLLVKAGVLADDALIHRGTVQWGPEPGVLIRITPL